MHQSPVLVGEYPHARERKANRSARFGNRKLQNFVEKPTVGIGEARALRNGEKKLCEEYGSGKTAECASGRMA
jgi:hypothetical protein